MRRTIELAAACGAILALGGCLQSRLYIADDFGRAVRQDVLAQVAEPDAKYVGVPEPGSHPERVGLAMDRYAKGEVIPPAATATSQVRTRNNGGGGSSPNQ